MVKLSFKNPKYFQYMENGKQVIKCTYSCEVYDNNLHCVINTFKVEGYSMCSENDTFNETQGKIIADSRAKAEAYRIARDMFNSCDICKMKQKITLYTKLLNFNKKMQYLKQQEDKHLNWVLKNADNQ